MKNIQHRHIIIAQTTNLEHAKDTVHTGSQSHSAISFWFLSFESYINSLIKLCCIKKNEPFQKYKKEDLHKRVASLAHLLGLNIKPEKF